MHQLEILQIFQSLKKLLQYFGYIYDTWMVWIDTQKNILPEFIDNVNNLQLFPTIKFT